MCQTEILHARKYGFFVNSIFPYIASIRNTIYMEKYVENGRSGRSYFFNGISAVFSVGHTHFSMELI